jgi:hypothetical protein
MSTNGVDRIEVTEAAQSEAAGDGVLSLGLLISAPLSDDTYSFASRENIALPGPRLILVVTNASKTFQSWISSFLTLADSEIQPQSDPDGDRLSNAEEFLFGLNPEQFTHGPVMSVHSAPLGIRLNYPQRKRWPADSHYVIEAATSLNPAVWLPAGGVEFSAAAELGETFSMNAFVPSNDDEQRFYRFRISPGL